jgi:uncharacterized RDD family membrane protein YckC
MVNHSGQLDTSIEIVTPENIAFRYQVAGPFRRLPAYLIDLAIRFGVGMVVLFVFSILSVLIDMPGLGMAGVLIAWFLLAWFYGGMFETFWNGQTPGKRLMQIRVLTAEGRPINGLQAVMRNLLRAIDCQPAMLYMIGLGVATANDRFQRVGDLACGTMVVVEERHWFRGVIRIDEPEARRLAGQIPADFQASRTLARALATYVQRRRFFPWGRRMEIARHLGEPLRERFGLPLDTNLDDLLSAAYHRTFITDRVDDEPILSGSPFREEPVVAAAVEPAEDAERRWTGPPAFEEAES